MEKGNFPAASTPCPAMEDLGNWSIGRRTWCRGRRLALGHRGELGVVSGVAAVAVIRI